MKNSGPFEIECRGYKVVQVDVFPEKQVEHVQSIFQKKSEQELALAMATGLNNQAKSGSAMQRSQEHFVGLFSREIFISQIGPNYPCHLHKVKASSILRFVS